MEVVEEEKKLAATGAAAVSVVDCFVVLAAPKVAPNPLVPPPKGFGLEAPNGVGFAVVPKSEGVGGLIIDFAVEGCGDPKMLGAVLLVGGYPNGDDDALAGPVLDPGCTPAAGIVAAAGDGFTAGFAGAPNTEGPTLLIGGKADEEDRATAGFAADFAVGFASDFFAAVGCNALNSLGALPLMGGNAAEEVARAGAGAEVVAADAATDFAGALNTDGALVPIGG